MTYHLVSWTIGTPILLTREVSPPPPVWPRRLALVCAGMLATFLLFAVAWAPAWFAPALVVYLVGTVFENLDRDWHARHPAAPRDRATVPIHAGYSDADVSRLRPWLLIQRDRIRSERAWHERQVSEMPLELQRDGWMRRW